MARDSYVSYKNIDYQAWLNAHEDDLWLFDKLILSRRLGYKCGARGVDVPSPGEYIVRPCVNFMGMGEGSRIIYIEKCTDHVLKPGGFWCEVFKGRHLSVDYKNGKQDLTVEGFKKDYRDTRRFHLWSKVTDTVSMPDILKSLKGDYEFINVEMINGKVIEVHLRKNPDFEGHESNYVRPIWREGSNTLLPNEKFVEAREGSRLGFAVQDTSNIQKKRRFWFW